MANHRVDGFFAAQIMKMLCMETSRIFRCLDKISVSYSELQGVRSPPKNKVSVTLKGNSSTHV